MPQANTDNIPHRLHLPSNIQFTSTSSSIQSIQFIDFISSHRTVCPVRASASGNPASIIRAGVDAIIIITIIIIIISAQSALYSMW
jgi:hypothetical protein